MTPEQLKLFSSDHWDTYLHDSQGYLGRCYLVLKRQTTDDMLTLTPTEQEDFFIVARKVKKALQHLFKPLRLNYANLQNTWTQLHVHIIPRYDSLRTFAGHTFTDPNPQHLYDPKHKTDLSEKDLFQIRDEVKKQL